MLREGGAGGGEGGGGSNQGILNRVVASTKSRAYDATRVRDTGWPARERDGGAEVEFICTTSFVKVYKGVLRTVLYE